MNQFVIPDFPGITEGGGGEVGLSGFGNVANQKTDFAETEPQESAEWTVDAAELRRDQTERKRRVRRKKLGAKTIQP